MSAESDSDLDEYCDVDQGKISIKCIFCEEMFKSIELCKSHMESNHKFSIQSIKSQQSFNFYDYIKIINYLRLNPCDINKFQQQLWKDDKFMIPVIPNDPLLYAFDDDQEDFEEDQQEDDYFQASQQVLADQNAFESISIDKDVLSQLLQTSDQTQLDDPPLR